MTSPAEQDNNSRQYLCRTFLAFLGFPRLFRYNSRDHNMQPAEGIAADNSSVLMARAENLPRGVGASAHSPRTTPQVYQNILETFLKQSCGRIKWLRPQSILTGKAAKGEFPSSQIPDETSGISQTTHDKTMTVNYAEFCSANDFV